jgi:hypothetical protein
MRPWFRLVVSIDLGRRGGEMIATFLSRLDGSDGLGILRAKLVVATSNSEFMHTRAQSRLRPPNQTVVIVQGGPHSTEPMAHAHVPHSLRLARTIPPPLP